MGTNMTDFTKYRLTTKWGHVFIIWSDSHRLWCQKESEYPINVDKDEHVVFEWKHSYAVCADDIVEAIFDKVTLEEVDGHESSGEN